MKRKRGRFKDVPIGSLVLIKRLAYTKIAMLSAELYNGKVIQFNLMGALYGGWGNYRNVEDDKLVYYWET